MIYPLDWKCVAVFALLRSHAKLSETLPLVPEIRDSIRYAKVIWDRESTILHDSKDLLEGIEEFEVEMKPKLDDGVLCMDDACWPAWAEIDDIGQRIC